MNSTRIPLPAINNAIRDVCLALEEGARRPPSWTSMTEDDLWRELVACILGSRVRFDVALSAVERMGRRRLFCKHRRSSGFQQYEQDVISALSEAGASGVQSSYPFSRLRAKQIRRAAEWLFEGPDSLRTFLKDSPDIRDVRRRLASEVPGLGPKQASLFLRNIGYATRVAVLDIHILTYMSWVGLIDAPVKSVPTVRRYEALEDAFIEHAYSCGFTPDCFDLAVWVVVRVVKEEQEAWR